MERGRRHSKQGQKKGWKDVAKGTGQNREGRSIGVRRQLLPTVLQK